MDLDLWPLFLLVWCSGSWCNDCNMTKVKFVSRNFHSKLQWEEVKIPGREVRYSVRYHAYGERSKTMSGCQNISETSCDLSSVMTDIRSKYFVKVMDDALCLGQVTHFVPLERTSLEAPVLSVLTSESSLTVALATPMGPQNRSIREISCWERCQDSGISSVNYIVSLTQPESEAGKVFHNTSGLITLSHLEADTQYCGVALYELSHPSIKSQSENATFCVTLPATYKPWILVLFMSMIVALFLLIILALILCQQYIRKKRNLPKALHIMSASSVPHFNTDPKVQINPMLVCTSTEHRTHGHTERPQNTEPIIPYILGKSITVSLMGCPVYRNKDWKCHSYTNQQVAPLSDQSAESCTSYSMVVGVRIPQEQEEMSDSAIGDSISPGFSSYTEEDLIPVTPDSDPEENLPVCTSEPFLLPVSRLENGTLEFTDLAARILAPNVKPSSETTPLVVGEGRSLLLAHLISPEESIGTDSELSDDYRKAYLPNGVLLNSSELSFTETQVLLSDLTSNYRDNWVPGISSDPPLSMDCLMSETRLREAEEDAEESPSVLKANFLNQWMVQIQG